MYIYFDNQGKQKAVIPHGEIPREGSALNIYVCLPYDFWSSKNKTDGNYSKTIELIYPDKSISVAMSPIYNIADEVVMEGEEATFLKQYACEPTYDFMEGGAYLRYHWSLNGEEVKAGKITAIIKFAATDDTIINGTVQIFVEKTYYDAKRTAEEKILIKYDDIIKEIGNVKTSKVDKNTKIAGLEIQDGINAEDLNKALSGGMKQSYRREIEFTVADYSGDNIVYQATNETVPEKLFDGANYTLKFKISSQSNYPILREKSNLSKTVIINKLGDISFSVVGKNFTAGQEGTCTLFEFANGFAPLDKDSIFMTATYTNGRFILDEFGVSQNFQIMPGEVIYKLRIEDKLPNNGYIYCSKDFNPSTAPDASQEWDGTATNKTDWLRKGRIYQIVPHSNSFPDIKNLGIVAISKPDEGNYIESQIFAINDKGNIILLPHTTKPTQSPREGLSVPLRQDDNLWTKDYPDDTAFTEITDNQHLVMPKKYIDDNLAKKLSLKPIDTTTIELPDGKKLIIGGDFEVTKNLSVLKDLTVKENATIEKDLTVVGNLTVTGTTTTINSTTLQIKDKLLEIAKDNITALTSPAGFFVRNADGTNNYGIVFDNSGKLYYGKIVLDEDGNVSTTSQLTSLDEKFESINEEIDSLRFQEYNTSTFDQVYVKTKDGEKALYNVTKGVEENSVAMRGTDGRVKVGNAFSPATPTDYDTESYQGRIFDNEQKPSALNLECANALLKDKIARNADIQNPSTLSKAGGAISYDKDAKFITPEYVNIAVKKALCGTKRLGTETSAEYANTALSDEEKDLACDILGALRNNIAPGEGKYVLIEKVITGYTVLETAPEDFTTNYASYYKTNGKARNDVDFNYVALTEAETFETGKYYSKTTGTTNIFRFGESGKEPDGTPYAFKHIFVNFENSNTTLGVWDPIHFYVGNLPTDAIYYGGLGLGVQTNKSQVNADMQGNAVNIYGMALTSENTATKFQFRKREILSETNPVLDGIRIHSLPADTTVLIYGVRAKDVGDVPSGGGLTEDEVNTLIDAKTADFAKKSSENTFAETQTFNKNIYVNGDIIQNGASYSTHAEKLYTKKDFIILRDGSTTALGSGNAGLVALNYADKNGFLNGGLVYDGNGYARVGDISFTYTALETKPTYANAIGLYYLSNGNYIEITQSSVSETQYGNITAVYEQHIDASQAQTIATRSNDTDLTDQHILIWNETTKQLIDSGKTVADFVAAKKAYDNPSAMPNDTLSVKAYCTTTQKDASGNVTENPFDVCSVSDSGANAAIARYDENGQLTVTKDPTSDNHLVRKAYADSLKLYKHTISAFDDAVGSTAVSIVFLSHKSTAFESEDELRNAGLNYFNMILSVRLQNIGIYSVGDVTADHTGSTGETLSFNGSYISGISDLTMSNGSIYSISAGQLSNFSDTVEEIG